MRIACIGYREWALKIYTNIQKKSDHIFLNIKNFETYSDQIIKDFSPDLVMFYRWSWIVSKELIENFTCLMLHPSPLPLYRGGSPIQNQIIEGRKTSKVSIIIMTEELDAGPIVGQMDISLEGNISDIFQELTEKGTFLTEDILENGLKPEEQDHKNATVYKRRKPEESEITIEEIKTKSAEYLHNKIRMLQDPYPNAYIKTSEGKRVYLTSSKTEN